MSANALPDVVTVLVNDLVAAAESRTEPLERALALLVALRRAL